MIRIAFLSAASKLLEEIGSDDYEAVISILFAYTKRNPEKGKQ